MSSSITLEQVFTSPQSITSPLTFYTMTFDASTQNLFVTCNIPNMPGITGTQKSIIVDFGAGATFLKLTPSLLVINTSPTTIVCRVGAEPAGLEIQDSGNVVIYDSQGNVEWTWYFATGSTTPPSVPAVLFEAEVVHVQEAIDILRVTFDALRQKVGTVQAANSDEEPVRMKSDFPEPITDTHARKIA
jgi:hypothetical protein